MIIQVSGYKDVLDKDTKQLKGIEVHGVQTVPDRPDPLVHGKLSFRSYFSLQNLEGIIPLENQEYEVVFSISEFQGEYTARPHHLKEV